MGKEKVQNKFVTQLKCVKWLHHVVLQMKIFFKYMKNFLANRIINSGCMTKLSEKSFKNIKLKLFSISDIANHSSLLGSQKESFLNKGI